MSKYKSILIVVDSRHIFIVLYHLNDTHVPIGQIYSFQSEF